MPSHEDELVQNLVNCWIAGETVVVLAGEDLSTMQQSVNALPQYLAKAGYTEPVRAIFHDRVIGLHGNIFQPSAQTVNAPDLAPRSALTNMFGVDALRVHMLNEETMKLQMDSVPPRNNIVFGLKGWEHDLFPAGSSVRPNPELVVQLRSLIHGNAGTAVGGRGRRLLVFMCASADVPVTLPELSVIRVKPLSRHDLRDVVTSELDLRRERLERLSSGVSMTEQEKQYTPGERQQHIARLQKQLTTWEDPRSIDSTVAALAGLSYFSAQQAQAMATVEAGGMFFPNILPGIERRKAIKLGEIRGLHYVPRGDLEEMTEQPGYEKLTTFVSESLGIPEELASKHNLRPFKGVVLAGRPGTGKTVAAKQLAKVLNKMLVIWNIGESQGKYVGESEQQVRKVLDICNSMEAVVLLDDFDKAGANSSRGGQAGDSGVFSRVIQTLLTELSNPKNRAVFLFTMNRLTGVPPEIIRAERVDERFFVEAPNTATRKSILEYHIRHMGFADVLADPKFQSGLSLVADQTQEWVGAELATIITRAARRVLRGFDKSLSTEWMMETVRQTTPMSKSDIYAQDIRDMEDAAKEFVHIGNVVSEKTSEKTSDNAVDGRRSSLV